MKALIDGDIICYSCGFAAQKTLYEVRTRTIQIFEKKKEAHEYQQKYDPSAMIMERIEAERVENALHSAKLLIKRCLEETQSNEHIIFLTGNTNFRDERVKRLSTENLGSQDCRRTGS